MAFLASSICFLLVSPPTFDPLSKASTSSETTNAPFPFPTHIRTVTSFHTSCTKFVAKMVESQTEEDTQSTLCILWLYCPPWRGVFCSREVCGRSIRSGSMRRGGGKMSAFRRVREALDLSVKEICWVLAEPELWNQGTQVTDLLRRTTSLLPILNNHSSHTKALLRLFFFNVF